MKKKPITLLIHISFVIILLGALVTHLWGSQGAIHLRLDEAPKAEYETEDGLIKKLPFSISLKDFAIDYYNGTNAEMDYVSSVQTSDGHFATIQMNNIFSHHGYRFYQSSYDSDKKGSVFSVTHDPWGIGITYTGYLLLFHSLMAFFFQKRSYFRSLCRKMNKQRSLRTILLLIVIFSSVHTFASPRVLPKETANEFGKLYVYYNHRICPLQTVAYQFTTKIYGHESFNGFTPEQVFTGWFFFYDEWKSDPSFQQVISDAKNEADAAEKQNIVNLLGTGGLLKIYPYKGEWYSLADKLPTDMNINEWQFIRYSMDYVAEQVAMQNDAKAKELIGKIRKYQIKQCRTLPTEVQYNAERWYNATNYNKVISIFCITIGFVLFLVCCFRTIRTTIPCGVLCLIFCYLTLRITLRTIVGGHIPLSNGFETMQFMAWCAVLTSLIFTKRWPFVMPFGFLVVGFCMLVAMIGEKSPQITQLVPVLNSPLLSIHVLVIMVSYALFAFIMLNGLMGLVLICLHKSPTKVEELKLMSQIVLYPATFLLTIGIFIGAIWANQSWGRYWGWDPKETWALITMLVYSIGLHTAKIRCLRKPIVFHMFCIIAFVFVLITYIGVNYFMGGKHSYA